MTSRTRIAALAVAASLAVPAVAAADVRHGGDTAGGKVVGTPKLLSVKAAAKLRTRIEKGKSAPKPPRLKIRTKRLERGHLMHEVPVTGEQPEPGARMFGNEYGYAYKRDRILGAIQNFNATFVPQFGGRYTPPALYELPNGGLLPGCSDGVYNGAYCPGANTLGWSMAWTNDAFTRSGDMKWATLIAHEYGHAAQRFLNIRGGWMQYRQYSEGFADCMAGAFLWYAAYNGMVDSVGRGDYNEFRDALYSLQSPVTNLNTHGTYDWRYSLATYGWNTGFRGCTNWARSIDGV
jgi:hypothetical protein